MLVLVKRFGFFTLFALLLLFTTACSSSDATEAAMPSDDLAEAPAEPPRFVTTSPVAPDDHRPILVIFGDSLSAGYGLDPGLSYPDDLQELFDERGIDWRIVNLSVSGDTTAGGVARIDSALAVHPDYIIIELGGNDGLRGIPLTATREDLAKMIEAFQDSGAHVMLAGMTLPPNYGPDYIAGFEGIYKDLSEQYKTALIPFLLSDMVTEDLRYFQDDHIHPTADGAEIVAETVYQAITPELENTRTNVH